MGLNKSGIVINKNLKGQREELAEILSLNLEFDKEIDFGIASENWKEEGIIDVYFGENGTLVFADIDLCMDGYSYPGTNILTFAISESSMVFVFAYTENDEYIRSKTEINGEIFDDQGSELEIEAEESDLSEVILEQMNIVLGEKFWDISPDAKAVRFLVKNSDETDSEPLPLISELEISKQISEQEFKTNKTKISNKKRPENNSGIYMLAGLTVLGLLLIIGLIYAIYSIFKL